ncbi:histidine ammonia-lyase [Effusibacillus pohliae]|uniref:histidine ammonia-lyase n=1 Tax=Effusibacillus pohliae TaxID=232270 RepID=UPI000367CA8C|nr:histidine ammonia-lyase [Effusibacillus pohliae]
MVTVDGSTLQLEDVIKVACAGEKVAISPEAWERVARCRARVEQMVANRETVYGVTTGFGKFADVSISPGDAEQLQANLIRSHACAVGTALPQDVARAIMVLRANALAKGYSGISEATLRLLVDCLNHGVHPVIPEKGSLGASGDLAPLSHLALLLMGEGEAKFQGKRMPAQQALARAGLAPVRLRAKEGLALINGTQVMTAIGALTFARAERLAKIADVIAAMTCEVLRGIADAYDEGIQQVRPYPEQAVVAANLRDLLHGSQLTTRQGELRVQDAYSLRCIPQVHGAVRQVLTYVADKLAVEINAATDNPLIFLETGRVISGGNFHGQPIAFAMDFLKIGLSELANISERRLERMVNGQLSGGLPPFLSRRPGLESGMMIAQYVAASLVSENKVLCHPSSVDSIPSSANQEDHVSMGTNAAQHAAQVVENAARVLAIELIAACEAAEHQGADRLAPATRVLYEVVRETVEPILQDRSLTADIERTARALLDGSWLQRVQTAVMVK